MMTIIALALVGAPIFMILYYAVTKSFRYFVKRKPNIAKPLGNNNSSTEEQSNNQTSEEDEIAAVIAIAVKKYLKIS